MNKKKEKWHENEAYKFVRLSEDDKIEFFREGAILHPDDVFKIIMSKKTFDEKILLLAGIINEYIIYKQNENEKYNFETDYNMHNLRNMYYGLLPPSIANELKSSILGPNLDTSYIYGSFPKKDFSLSFIALFCIYNDILLDSNNAQSYLDFFEKNALKRKLIERYNEYQFESNRTFLKKDRESISFLNLLNELFIYLSTNGFKIPKKLIDELNKLKIIAL